MRYLSGCNTDQLGEFWLSSTISVPEDILNSIDFVVFPANRLEVASDKLIDGVSLDLGIVSEVFRGKEEGEPTGSYKLLSGDNNTGDFDSKKRGKHC
jgi:hypothetical protein